MLTLYLRIYKVHIFCQEMCYLATDMKVSLVYVRLDCQVSLHKMDLNDSVMFDKDMLHPVKFD